VVRIRWWDSTTVGGESRDDIRRVVGALAGETFVLVVGVKVVASLF